MANSQKDARMTISNEIARIHVVNLTESVKNLLIELIVNMREVGCQD
jgi:hypothetical protein